eukprot:1709444-Amphidinium_carterae.1
MELVEIAHFCCGKECKTQHALRKVKSSSSENSLQERLSILVEKQRKGKERTLTRGDSQQSFLEGGRQLSTRD